MDHSDVIVLGAGVVGLSIARALAIKGREVLILEAESMIASVTSARNSGVIHAGIYYKPHSIKAATCVEGRQKLYEYATARNIPHRRCGKLVVATSGEQVTELEHWHKTGLQNGVDDLSLITGNEARALEPNLSCMAAMLSPSTGIIDTHHYTLALLGDAENAGATLALSTPVVSGAIENNRFIINTGGETPSTLSCATLINALGLGAQGFAHKLDGLNPATIPPLVLAKGNYFSLQGQPPFTRLIYPLPVPGSSGLHFSVDLGNRPRFGPDVEWVDHIDYQVDATRARLFEESIRRYWPTLPAGVLQPDFAGIRPKTKRGSPHDSDFIIQTHDQHGIKGLINLYGIESPGLTASLALGDKISLMI